MFHSIYIFSITEYTHFPDLILTHHIHVLKHNCASLSVTMIIFQLKIKFKTSPFRTNRMVSNGGLGLESSL